MPNVINANKSEKEGGHPVTCLGKELTLPWPPKGLSPNDRIHWAAKSKITKAYKQVCWALCKEAGMVAPDSQRIALWIDLYPPDRRGRDDDNIIASFKAGRDGLALALGVDDKRFVLKPFVKDQVGGYIKVRLTSHQESA